MPRLQGLYVQWSGSGVQNVDALYAASRLQYFHLGSSPSLASIEPLADLDGLRWLGLENVKRVQDVGPLGRLTGLQGLSLEGSTSTTQHVRTLEPIGRLRELRYLSIANLRAHDGTKGSNRRTARPAGACRKTPSISNTTRRRAPSRDDFC